MELENIKGRELQREQVKVREDDVYKVWYIDIISM